MKTVRVNTRYLFATVKVCFFLEVVSPAREAVTQGDAEKLKLWYGDIFLANLEKSLVKLQNLVKLHPKCALDF